MGLESLVCDLRYYRHPQLQVAKQMSIKNWFRRFFPESLFSRKMDPAAERRVRLAQARAEEATIRTHVDNALMFVDVLAEDMTFDRAIDAYVREMAVPEPLASTVATRTLVILGQELVPYRKRAQAAEEERPKLRLNDASEGRQTKIKRA